MSLQFAANLPKILEAQERAANLSKLSSNQLQFSPVTSSISSQVPIYLAFHFLLAHVLTTTRPLKVRLKIDHNANPRQDLVKYAEPAAKAGKISDRQLRLLTRLQACHENLIENLPVFLGAVIFASIMGEVRYGGMDVGGAEAGERLEKCRNRVNWLCAVFTIAKMVYVGAYLAVERGKGSYIRSGAWWAGNVICWMLVAEGGRAVNANVK